MAATFIQARVVKHNNDVYLTEDENSTVGVIMAIPTPGAGGVIDGDYWADPIADNGILTGYNFTPTTPDSEEAPSPQAFHVFRIITRFGNDVFYAIGSTTGAGSSPFVAGYIEAAADAECCSETPATLPTTGPTLYPCQTSCILTAGVGAFQFILQLPLPRSGALFTGNGFLNGNALPEVTGATPALLQTALNANWTNVGSPNVVVTWTVSADGVVVGTVTDGDGTEDLCAKFV
jgi:hypothetical protein